MKIIFTRPNHFSLFSWLVRKLEKSEFSHCAMLVNDQETLLPIVIHSDRYRVRCVAYSNFITKNVIVKHIDVSKKLTPYDKMEFKKFAINSYGIGYGTGTIIGMLFCRLFKIKNIFADKTKTMVCSEFIIRGTNLKDLDPEVDGPKAVYKALGGV